MRRSQFIVTIIGLSLSLSVSSCRKKSNELNLGERITAAHTSQYCRLPDACFNPHVLAVENGYSVTTFMGAKPQYVHVATGKLAEHLQRLPMQAWPLGPSILISPTDDVIDGRAVQQNLDAAQQLCRSMGLNVQIRPGG
jgi:hypothetical protein